MESWELEIEADLLRQERDEAQADAERYRWLRDVDDVDFLTNLIELTGEEFDAAIDAARRGE